MASPIHSSVRFLTAPVKVSLAIFGVLTAGLCLLLWPHWRSDPDLVHGLAMPVVFAILLYSASKTPGHHLRPGFWLIAGSGTLGAVSLLFAIAGGLYATMLGWSNSLVAFMLTSSFVVLGAGAGLVLASNRVRIWAWNWPGTVALGLWWLCTPLPPGSYARLTLSLQLALSRALVDTLHLLGIAAFRQGNILVLTTGAVGIEDACSGVRSLLSCLFAAAFLSGFLVKRPGHRLLLIAAAIPAALITNYLRSLVLTLLAARSLTLNDRWHDTAGYTAASVAAAALLLLALRLSKSGRVSPADEPPTPAPPVSGLETWLLSAVVCAAAAIVGLFVVHSRSTPLRPGKSLDLAAALPAEVKEWQVVTVPDLDRYSPILGTHELLERVYTRKDDAVRISIYVAHWSPGQASLSRVDSHTPDICWPGSGWELAAEHDVSPSNFGPYPAGESRVFHLGNSRQFVWYWHLYDGRQVPAWNVFSPWELLQVAFYHGFRPNAEQLFVRVSSNLPWRDTRLQEPVNQALARLLPSPSGVP